MTVLGWIVQLVSESCCAGWRRSEAARSMDCGLLRWVGRRGRVDGRRARDGRRRPPSPLPRPLVPRMYPPGSGDAGRPTSSGQEPEADRQLPEQEHEPEEGRGRDQEGSREEGAEDL